MLLRGSLFCLLTFVAAAEAPSVSGPSPTAIKPGAVDASLNAGAFSGGGVRAVIRQSSGHLLIGGGFTNVQGVARGGFARLSEDGTLDPSFASGPGIAGTNRFVAALVRRDEGKILIGGSFETVHGIPRRGIARLNSDGSLDPTFNPGIGPDWPVLSIAVEENGKILIAGDFAKVNGTDRMGLARLNADGTLDTAYKPMLGPGIFTLFGGSRWTVRKIAIQSDGKLLVGGFITASNGTEIREGLFRLRSDGTLDTTFNAQLRYAAGPGFPVVSRNLPQINSFVVQPDGKIVIAGVFTALGSDERHWLARIHPNGTLDSSFNASTHAALQVQASIVIQDVVVESLALQPDGKLIVGGNFKAIDKTPWPKLARLNTNGFPDFTFELGTGPDDVVRALLFQLDGKLLIAGDFRNVNSSARASLVRLHALPVTFGPPLLLSEPPDRAVHNGAPVAFNVFASGSSLTYQWHRNGTNLVGETNVTLLIASAGRTHTGSYAVTVQNELGKLTSRAALLKVLDLGEALDMPELTWRTGGVAAWAAQNQLTHDGVDAAESPRLLDSQHPTGEAWIETTLEGPGLLNFWQRVPTGYNLLRIEINGLTQPYDFFQEKTSWKEKTYTVPFGTNRVRWVAAPLYTNAFYIDEVRFTPVTGVSAPQFTQQPEGATALAGMQTISLTSQATGTEPIIYFWHKDGWLVQSGTNRVLQLRQPTIFDAGAYSVIASNSWGVATSSAASVTIQLAPIIGIHPASVSAEAGARIEFNVLAAAAPPPSYQWKFNGQNIAGETTSTLVLFPTSAHVGSYSVEVSNPFGTVTSAPAKLTLRTEPLDAPRFVGTQQFTATPSKPGGSAAFASEVDAIMDDEGNLFIASLFRGTVALGNTNVTSLGELDLLLAKFSRAGELLWAVTAGESGAIVRSRLGLAPSGGVSVLANAVRSVRFGEQRYSETGTYSVVAHYDERGQLIGARNLGPSTLVGDFTADSRGNLLIADDYRKPPAFMGPDSSIKKYTPSSELLWSVEFDTGLGIPPSSLATDSAGYVYAIGRFFRSVRIGDFTLLGGGLNQAGDLYSDIYVAKLDRTGNVLRVNQFGRPVGQSCFPAAITVDSLGHSYVVGSFTDQGKFGNFSLRSVNRTYDVFVAKVDPEGRTLWSVIAGGRENDAASDVALDGQGNVYGLGFFFRGGSLAKQEGDLFITRHSNEGQFHWTKIAPHKYLTHFSDVNLRWKLAANRKGDVRVVGIFDGTIQFDESTLTSEKPALFITQIVNPAHLLVPSLQAQLSGNQFVLQWAATGGEWMLQEAITLHGPWTDVTSSPSVVDQKQRFSLPLRQDQQFFRLRAK